MKFLSVCSGIEAASVAWRPLGWEAVAFSEIEPFPCAVLAHHYPNVPNWGDMTKFQEWPDVAVDLLCGGTPCQSFSVAGLRAGLADPRGNLMLTYGAIAAKYRPRWLVWENVPGVLSSNGGRDFGSFLGLLGQLGYGFAYRVLDAQYFGVPQRRRRVFVVGCLGDWRRAAAVLFERHSLSGHPAPSRETRQGIAAGTLRSTDGGCDLNHARAGHIVEAFGGNNRSGSIDCAAGLNAKGGAGRMDFDSETFVTHALTGEGFDASEDGTGRGTPLIPIDMRQASRGATMTNNRAEGSSGGAPGTGVGEDGDPAPTISTSHTPAICFSAKDHGADAMQDRSPTLRAGGHSGSHANAGVMPAVALALRGREGGATAELGDEVGNALRASTGGGDKAHVLAAMQVRRLTPVECARLQGFPDHYLDITYRGKPAADGPKYRALGNSWAVPVINWIGRRIQQVDGISTQEGRHEA